MITQLLLSIAREVVALHLKFRFALRCSLNGLRVAFRDKSVRIEVWSGLIVVGILWWLWPFSTLELFMILISYFLILIVELINTAIEEALDFLHPDMQKEIGWSKDIAASAVLLTIVFFVVVLTTITLSRLGFFA